MAGHLKVNPPERIVRVVFFVNEEWPFSGGIQMGSNVYAKRCKARQDRIVAMIAVDSIGCYSNEKGSQRYPAMVGWSLPSKGNFVAFGSDLKNRPLLDLVVGLFQKQCRFPSIGAATDSRMAARSDHAPFWWQGYPAIQMSDTSEYRDANNTRERLQQLYGCRFSCELEHRPGGGCAACVTIPYVTQPVGTAQHGD